MVYGPTECDPVGGDHGDLVAAVAAFLKPQVYLELGCLEGATLKKVAPHCGKALGIDHKAEPVADNGFTIIRADTVWFLEQLKADSVEMVFLDSSHEYAHSLRELVQIERVLVENGVLLMHDTYPPNAAQEQPGYCGDVWRLAAELDSRPGWQAMTLPAQYGLTLARKLPAGWKQLAWKA